MWKPALRRTHRNASREAFAPGRALHQKSDYHPTNVTQLEVNPAPIRARPLMATLSGGRVSKATLATGYFPSPSGRKCQAQVTFRQRSYIFESSLILTL
ncbi:MAG: hypothetical protein HY774_13755 [Acidobacteria bacterium]|nr:hypothetical protein [Acidobacteriota bacterium]